MPELAEVEYYRKQWDPGINHRIIAVMLHSRKRVFRFTRVRQFKSSLTGARLLSSQASGKQMLFRFSRQGWLGIHLGMTGELRLEPASFRPARHDHLVLYQSKRALVFSDMRQFGAVRFEQSPRPPEWWTSIGLPVTSPQFTPAVMCSFLSTHRKLPIKASLLLQRGFPGVGNWMADEILWRARIHPRRPSASLSPDEVRALWTSVRFVCREAIRHIGHGFSDPPRNWLIHERWSGVGKCPRDHSPLQREVIAGRTAAWCSKCQPFKQGGSKPRRT